MYLSCPEIIFLMRRKRRGTLTITEAAIFAELLLRQDFPEEDLDIPSLADLGISGFGSEDSFMALHTPLGMGGYP